MTPAEPGVARAPLLLGSSFEVACGPFSIMALTDLLSPDAIVSSLRANSKKATLGELCERAGAVYGLDAKAVLEAVTERERLGSTGIGKGIAIPHGKLADCPRLFGVFARLERPIPFDAVDGEPVDLAFLLLAPRTAGADHLKALARVARSLRDPHVTARLRATRDAATILAIFGETPTSHAA
jgi:PTS system nitrogen regulatory IIA component